MNRDIGGDIDSYDTTHDPDTENHFEANGLLNPDKDMYFFKDPHELADCLTPTEDFYPMVWMGRKGFSLLYDQNARGSLLMKQNVLEAPKDLYHIVDNYIPYGERIEIAKKYLKGNIPDSELNPDFMIFLTEKDCQIYLTFYPPENNRAYNVKLDGIIDARFFGFESILVLDRNNDLYISEFPLINSDEIFKYHRVNLDFKVKRIAGKVDLNSILLSAMDERVFKIYFEQSFPNLDKNFAKYHTKYNVGPSISIKYDTDESVNVTRTRMFGIYDFIGAGGNYIENDNSNWMAITTRGCLTDEFQDGIMDGVLRFAVGTITDNNDPNRNIMITIIERADGLYYSFSDDTFKTDFRKMGNPIGQSGSGSNLKLSIFPSLE